MKKTQSNHKMSEFISKLLDMMQKFPHYIFWTDNHDELLFTNLKFISEEILPFYFRHSNFSSFIRQLNMYGFCKKEKHKDSLKFKHKIFKQGNQKQYHMIKRKSKQKQLSQMQIKCQDEYSQQIINKKIKKNSQIFEIQKEILLKMLQLKHKKQNILANIKQNISLLISYSGQQNDYCKGIIQEIKNQFSYPIANSIHKAKEIKEMIDISENENYQNSVQMIGQDQQYSSFSQQCSFQKNNDEGQRSEISCKNVLEDKFLQNQQIESVFHLQNDHYNIFWGQN